MKNDWARTLTILLLGWLTLVMALAMSIRFSFRKGLQKIDLLEVTEEAKSSGELPKIIEATPRDFFTP
ncbi:hypothetical protein LB505_007754 [Fusarium chuoi]|nr:hypothetical protein LB505_007754 [Fusarium chuoi]